MLQLLVQDFGIGINKAEQTLIVSSFTQLNKGSSKLHKGYGLGLSVIKGVLEVLNGKIEKVSAIQEESTFIVSIPESTKEVDQSATEANEWF